MKKLNRLFYIHGPEKWSLVHIGHEYITVVGLLFILVNSFSGWSEVIGVPDKKISTIKQILMVILQKRVTKNPGI